MKKVKRPTADLEQKLRNQIQFMHDSCESYDNGSAAHAEQLAHSIRIILHDTNHSHSLLAQLGLKNKVMFMDTSEDYNPQNKLPFAGLCLLQIGAKTGYIPRLNEPLKRVPSIYIPGSPLLYFQKPKLHFDDWWCAIVIATDQIKFSRKDIVLHLADTDGGSHVDPELDKSYYDVTRGGAMGKIIVKTKQGIEEVGVLRPVEYASVRQIAYEVIISLIEQYPKYFSRI
ncbi:hypothetical protein IH992_25420 [Candidatus Poribacteria bacterium]|nr:hypothetical protein [Candidatus Poribacteria bacterium]